MFPAILGACRTGKKEERNDRERNALKGHGGFFKSSFLLVTPQTQYSRTTHKQKNAQPAIAQRQEEDRSNSGAPPHHPCLCRTAGFPLPSLPCDNTCVATLLWRPAATNITPRPSSSRGSVARRGTSRGVVVGRRRQWGHRHFAIVNGCRTSFVSTLNYRLLGCAKVAS